MTQSEAESIVKRRLDEYIQLTRGITVQENKLFHCLNPQHEDRNPSMSYHNRLKYPGIVCWACGYQAGLIDLIKNDQHLNTGEAFAFAYDFFNLEVYNDKGKRISLRYSSDSSQNSGQASPSLQSHSLTVAKSEPSKGVLEPQRVPESGPDLTDYFKSCNERLDQTDYPQRRGLSRETCDRFMIGYDPHYTKSTGGEVWQVLIIPTSPHTYSARNLSSKGEGDRFRKYGPNHLLNVEAINQHNKPVIIVEGEIDALSVIEAGGEAVGLGSASNVNSFLASAKEADPEAVFIVALDNDEAGEKKGKELLEGLKALNLTTVNVNITPQHKDANEALQADRGELIYQIERAEAIAIEERENQKAALKEEQEREREAYLETSAYHGLNDFIKRIRATQKARCNPTGFHELDQLLDGGLYAGLYFIGAISSLGKTTFAIQVADNIAAKGNDVIIFSLEMDRDELLAKSISRLTFQIDHERTGAHRSAKTTRGVLTGAMRNPYNDDETALVNQAIAEYSKIASRLYFHIGVGDIGSGKVREVIDRHIAITGNRPVILIDYLQILSAPNNDKYLSDKMKTDDNVLELKRISRDHGIPIIGISSFNRDNYNEPVNLASFKESGAIEYSSDVLIGLQYAGMDYQDGETETNRRKRVRELYNKAQQDAKDGLPIQIELKILKNRNGTKGRVGLSYIPMFNYFEDSYTADPLISQSAQENSPLAFDDWQEVIPPKKESVQIEINASLDQGKKPDSSRVEPEKETSTHESSEEDLRKLAKEFYEHVTYEEWELVHGIKYDGSLDWNFGSKSPRIRLPGDGNVGYIAMDDPYFDECLDEWGIKDPDDADETVKNDFIERVLMPYLKDHLDDRHPPMTDQEIKEATAAYESGPPRPLPWDVHPSLRKRRYKPEEQ